MGQAAAVMLTTQPDPTRLSSVSDINPTSSNGSLATNDPAHRQQSSTCDQRLASTSSQPTDTPAPILDERTSTYLVPSRPPLVDRLNDTQPTGQPILVLRPSSSHSIKADAIAAPVNAPSIASPLIARNDSPPAAPINQGLLRRRDSRLKPVPIDYEDCKWTALAKIALNATPVGSWTFVDCPVAEIAVIDVISDQESDDVVQPGRRLRSHSDEVIPASQVATSSRVRVEDFSQSSTSSSIQPMPQRRRHRVRRLPRPLHQHLRSLQKEEANDDRIVLRKIAEGLGLDPDEEEENARAAASQSQSQMSLVPPPPPSARFRRATPSADPLDLLDDEMNRQQDRSSTLSTAPSEAGETALLQHLQSERARLSARIPSAEAPPPAEHIDHPPLQQQVSPPQHQPSPSQVSVPQHRSPSARVSPKRQESPEDHLQNDGPSTSNGMRSNGIPITVSGPFSPQSESLAQITDVKPGSWDLSALNQSSALRRVREDSDGEEDKGVGPSTWDLSSLNESQSLGRSAGEEDEARRRRRDARKRSRLAGPSVKTLDEDAGDSTDSSPVTGFRQSIVARASGLNGGRFYRRGSIVPASPAPIEPTGASSSTQQNGRASQYLNGFYARRHQQDTDGDDVEPVQADSWHQAQERRRAPRSVIAAVPPPSSAPPPTVQPRPVAVQALPKPIYRTEQSSGGHEVCVVIDSDDE